MKKRLLAVVFVVVLMAVSVLVVLVLNVKVQPSEKPKLSEMSYEEQDRILRELGAEFPEGHSEFVARIITVLEENPNYPAGMGFSNPGTVVFAWRIQEAVNKYYNIELSQEWQDWIQEFCERFGDCKI